MKPPTNHKAIFSTPTLIEDQRTQEEGAEAGTVVEETEEEDEDEAIHMKEIKRRRITLKLFTLIVKRKVTSHLFVQRRSQMIIS